MGNPISYRGKTLSWRGKQLTGCSDGTDTISCLYDLNGLRLRKTVTDANGTYVTDYHYNGTVLISQTTGADTLLFSYDAKGKAVSVRHIHTEENNTLTTNDYYYLRNAQSDIVKIIDGTGANGVGTELEGVFFDHI